MDTSTSVDTHHEPHPPSHGSGAAGAHDAAHEHHELGWWRKYIFSTDHKVIGIQYGLCGLTFLFFGFCLMMLMRWQLAYPGQALPVIGKWLPYIFGPGIADGKMTPDFYNSLGAMHGTIMFLFPISKWVGGILFEHTHRLMGSLVGFLTIILAVWLWLGEDRRWVRRLGVIAMVGVILQGILGGLRVTMMKDQIGIFHACVAQAFLGLLVFISLATTKFWRSLTKGTRAIEGGAPATPGLNYRRQISDSQELAPPSAIRFAAIKTLAISISAAIYVQLALGATMRHQHRDLSILDFPTANGAWIPDTSAAALAKINAWRDARALSDVTAFQIWLQMAHRFLALIIAIAIIAFCARVWRDTVGFDALKRLSLLWVVLVLCQIALGAWVIWSNKAADVASAHARSAIAAQGRAATVQVLEQVR